MRKFTKIVPDPLKCPCDPPIGYDFNLPCYESGISYWRSAVLMRDNFKCQKCGSSDNKLNVHHIIPYMVNTKHRFDIKNGITICQKLHRKFHKECGNNYEGEETFWIWFKNKNLKCE